MEQGSSLMKALGEIKALHSKAKNVHVQLFLDKVNSDHLLYKRDLD